jgi:hypothetical protein
MTPPKVFVSSTCYDLRQVRADLKDFIESFDYEPVLSEFDSFPVDSARGTQDNCLERVRSFADILVLLVGGRYGWPTDSGKSITNLEYLEARAKGIPIYVFVSKSVLAVLETWRANPSADFGATVDSPKVFEFVASLRDKGEMWVFPFEIAQDIILCLRKQFACLCGDSLRLRTRFQAAGLSDSLQQLRGLALKLLIERPTAWEMRLFSQVLADEIAKSADLKRDYDLGIALGPGPIVHGFQDVMSWASHKFAEASKITTAITALMNEALPRADGPPGTPADADAFVHVARKVADQYRALLEWTLDCRRVNVEPEFRKLAQSLTYFTRNFVREVEEFSDRLQSEITAALASLKPAGETRTIALTLKLTMPDVSEYHSEMGRLERAYGLH